MPEQEARRKLADRAFSIWRTADPAISYTTAVDKALAELNPNRQAIRAKAIIGTWGKRL